MADSEDEGVRDRLRTVTPSYFGHENTEMDIIGWTIFLLLLVVIIPVLPFILLLVFVSKLSEVLRGQTD